MKKYFKDESVKQFKLSEYLKWDASKFKSFLCDDERRKARTEYIMDIIGDVELDEDTYRLFIAEFQSFGGRYDVRVRKETFKGIYSIAKKYPFLSSYGLEQIWFVYISDQFEEYELEDVLGKFFELYGKTETALEKYLEYVDKTAEKFDRQFDMEAIKLDASCKDCDEDLLKHLQYIIKSQHIRAEQIISCIPSKELILEDKKQLGEIIRRSRIFFGACQPISYQMIESLATGEGLEDYPEQPKYSVTGIGTIATKFTKKEFLESIKRRTESLKRR